MSQNKADIKRESLHDHPMKPMSDMQMRLSGTNLTPWGFDYQGSATVHFFQKKGETVFAFMPHLVGVGALQEGQADAGLKELRKVMMSAFGRTDTKRGDTRDEL